jgi:prepilin-type N-terminal cleavage/methylation domain-containing protein
MRNPGRTAFTAQFNYDLISQGRRSKTAFTLVELLVVIAIIAILISLLLPMAQKAREQSRRVVCAVNLKHIGAAMKLYAADHGNYPKLYTDPGASGARYFSGNNQAEKNAIGDPFRPDIVMYNDVTGAIFLLVRNKYLTAKIFICPSTDHVAENPSAPASICRNFTLNDEMMVNTLSYSFANPYHSNATIESAKYRLTQKLPAEFVLAADRNECVNRMASSKPTTDETTLRQMNSKNHLARG